MQQRLYPDDFNNDAHSAPLICDYITGSLVKLNVHLFVKNYLNSHHQII